MLSSTLIRGALVAIAAALVIVAGTTLGVEAPWSLLLVTGVALAPRLTPGTIVSLLVGAAAWWGAMGLRAGVLPDTTSAEILATLAAVSIVTGLAAVSGDRVPLWAGLVGIGAFAGLYEPQFAANPTLFLTESTVALASIGVATSIAAIAGVAAAWLEGLTAQPMKARSRIGSEGVES
ncbi:MAG TPA: hypothetical protein VGA36_00665 [Nitriliruptorales bacterium]